MNEVQSDPQKFNKFYTKPGNCGRSYYDFEDLEIENNQKTGSEKKLPHMILCSCAVPRWCHPVKRSQLEKPYAQQDDFVKKKYCRLTQKQIKKEYPNNYKTNNGLCVPCLYKGICCFFYDHPNKNMKRKFDETEEIIEEEKKTYIIGGSNITKGSEFQFLTALIKEDNIIKNTCIEKIGTDENNISEEDRRIWTFKDNNNNRSNWLSEDFNLDYFLNRKCYDHFIKKIIYLTKLGFKNQCIYGTPGIGKSVFLNRVFHYIIESYRISENKEPITIAYSLKKFKSESHYLIKLYKENNKLNFTLTSFQTKISNEEVDYSIGDNFGTIKANEFSLYVSYYRLGNTISLRPDMERILEFMPLFSYNELSLISPPHWTEEQRKFRYMILGGCARNFRVEKHIRFSLEKGVLLDAINCFIPKKFREDIFFSHFCDICFIILNSFSNGYTQDNLEFTNLLSSTTVHFLPRENWYVSVWSTPIMKNISIFIREKINSDIWKQIRSLFNQSTIEGIFESTVHSKLISNGKKTYKFKHPDGRNIDVFFNISDVKYIWDEAGIEELQNHEYGLPLKENFAAVDAIIQPNILIQITKGDSHPIKQHLLNESRKRLRGDRNTHKLIYIIPPEVKSFKINNFSYQTPNTRSRNNNSTKSNEPTTIHPTNKPSISHIKPSTSETSLNSSKTSQLSANFIDDDFFQIDESDFYITVNPYRNDEPISFSQNDEPISFSQNDEIIQLVGYVDTHTSTDVLNKLKILS